jgi:hypothetical protein
MYLDEMNEPERDTFETHFFECSECAEDVKMGTLMTEAMVPILRAALGGRRWIPGATPGHAWQYAFWCA